MHRKASEACLEVTEGILKFGQAAVTRCRAGGRHELIAPVGSAERQDSAESFARARRMDDGRADRFLGSVHQRFV